jgi:hypothetical protein
MSRLHWPAAIVICVAFVTLASTAVLGPLTGLDGESLRFVLSGEGALGVIAAALIKPLVSGGK